MCRLLCKDFLHYFKIGGLFLSIFVILIGGFVYSYMYFEYEREIAIILIKNAMIFSCPTIAAMISVLLIQSSFASEIKDNVITVILANGFKPSEIWLSKLVSSYLIGYTCFVLSLGLNEIVVFLNWNYLLHFALQEIIFMFIIFPIIGFAVVAILWLIIWITKHIGIMIIGFVPTIIYIISIFFSAYIYEHNNIAVASIILVMILSIIILIAIIQLINRISLEYIANIHK